mmetsp:Transcript_26514/g.74872  ORF Transcript_26514/g.74872 Transcript_26514/m.74872 type:complete len:96 (+) Transcript_26514:491-778(+)
MALLSSLVGKCQMAAFVVLFFADHVLPQGVRENKPMSFFGIWLGGTMVGSALTKTSAFEIYLGKKLIWSSLRTERMPNLQDLVAGFKQAGITIQS